MDDLSMMRVFVEVVHAGSFSEAARRVDLSTAAVSRQIATLELSLGVKLVQRTTRRHYVTEAGRVWFDAAQRILGDVERSKREMSAFQDRPTGRLRVHLRTSIGESFIGPALDAFLRQYPEVQLDVTLTNRRADMLHEGVDVAVWVGEMADSSIVAKRLRSRYMQRSVVCASPSYLEANGRPTVPMELLQRNCLSYGYGEQVDQWRFLRDGTTELVPVQGNLVSSSVAILLKAAESGVGMLMLAEWCVNAALRAGQLEQVLAEYRVTGALFDMPIYVVFPSADKLPMKTRAFVDFLSRLFDHAVL